MSVTLGVFKDATKVSAFLDAVRDRFGVGASMTTMGTIDIYESENTPEISRQLVVSACNFLAGWNEAYDRDIARANLIAAAPELLEELEIAVMNCPCSIPARESGHLIRCRAPIWSKLIAKTKGKQ